MQWKKERGKLGGFAPLLGKWQAQAESKLGPVHCVREFEWILDRSYLQLKAHWEVGDTVYDELAIIGVNADKQVCFWSFTSDGKQSQGVLADVSDIHPKAIGFEAQMPAGVARTAYWPDDEQGFHWVVESKTKKGWNRFMAHHYRPI